MKTCRQKEHLWKHIGYNKDKSWVWNCEICGAGSLFNEKTKKVVLVEPQDNLIIKSQMIPKNLTKP